MKNLILLRHGECGDRGKYTGRGSDIPLSPEGRKQVRRMGELLRERGFGPGAVITGGLSRARESGQILASLWETPPEALPADDRLDELDFGLFEGKTYDEIRRAYPAESQLWFDDPWKNAPPRGETSAAQAGRVGDFYLSLPDLLERTGGDLVIAAHGGSLRFLICLLLETPPENHWHFRLERGGMARFELSGDFPVLAEWAGPLP